MPLTIVGPQPDRETAAALVRLAAGKQVVTSRKGSTTNSSCRSIGERVCIVLPSVYRTSIGTETAVPELLGQTLLEGMACETPAICTERGEPARGRRGRRDRVRRPAERPGRAWRSAANGSGATPGSSASMGKAARARVLARFTWDRVVQRCLEVYEGRAMLDRVVSTLRPLTVRGKGFVFDRVTPREGIRHATIAGAYAMRLDLANIIHRQIYMGCFANAMTRWTRSLLHARRHIPRRRRSRRLLLADCGRPSGTRRTRVRYRAQSGRLFSAACASRHQRDRAGRRVQLGSGRA